MRPNPTLDIKTVISELAVGEVLISLLEAGGAPGVTQRAWVVPPVSQIGPIDAQQRASLKAASVVAGVYDQMVDRESAYEKFTARVAEQAPILQQPPPAPPSSGGGLSDLIFGSTGPRGGRREGMVEVFAKSAARSVGSSVVRELTRGMFGSLLGPRRRR